MTRVHKPASAPINLVNKFKPCALTDININYTPEGMWMAYEGGMPVSVQMSLKFNELEPIYNTDYSDDIIEKRRFDETNNPMILLASINAPPPLFLKSKITASTFEALKSFSIFLTSLLLLL